MVDIYEKSFLNHRIQIYGTDKKFWTGALTQAQTQNSLFGNYIKLTAGEFNNKCLSRMSLFHRHIFRPTCCTFCQDLMKERQYKCTYICRTIDFTFSHNMASANYSF